MTRHSESPRGDGPPPRRPIGLFVLLGAAIGLVGLVVWLAGRYPDSLASQESMVNLVRYGGILALVCAGVLASGRFRLAKAVRDLSIWATILLLLLVGYSFRQELTVIGLRVGGEVAPHQALVDEDGALTFRRGADGHFHAEIEIDGTPIRFMIDTGASDIVLTPRDAARIGLDVAALSFTQRYQTANGVVWGAPVRLSSVAVGGIRFNDVRASVNGAEMDQSLLGMSFLDRFAGYEVTGDEMRLKP